MSTVLEISCHIAGRRIPGSGDALSSINPANGETLATGNAAAMPEIEQAIEAAREARRSWMAMSAAERGRVLARVAAILRERRDDLARLEVLDTGKPIQEAPAADIDSAADCFEFFAGLTQIVQGEHIPFGDDGFAYTRREPLGICAGIGAWNYPIQIASWKTAPALAAGNAMLFKPSEVTPLTALELGRIVEEAGAPPGLLSILPGGRETGEILSTHPAIAKISVTGSVPTGKAVMASAAGTLKHVTMELGGKSALLVFADADLDDAVSAAMLANFYTQGEICTNGTRVFVERPVCEAFLEKAKARAEAIRIGDPLDPETQMGPLIHAQHLDKVMKFVENGVREGARLVTGGKRLTDGDFAKGNFMQPTIFADVLDQMTICMQEIFGPVMSVLPFESEEEALRRANDTPFGLAAGVMTRDISRAHRVAAKLEAGVVWVNHYNLTPIPMPFGGSKMSGLGRENGLAALDFYTERKSVYVNLGGVESPY
nr:betaine-aldehyde dehydrogenase [Lutibaculum baratangense]